MKKITTTLIILMFLFSVLVANNPFSIFNQKESFEKYQGKEWIVLFDGTGLDNWMGKLDHKPPSSAWLIADGILSMSGEGGDIITKEKFRNFELVFEFKLTKEANSGIKYFVDSVLNIETGKFAINGPEYQIIDDYNNKVVRSEPNGTKSAAAAYLLYPPKNKKLKPHGEWNTGKIVSENGKVEHWLNSIKVLSYTRGSKDFLKRKAETKFKNDQNYGEFENGHIMLTDHNDKVYFRNIKIRKL